mgnify:CR=1 FL=1
MEGCLEIFDCCSPCYLFMLQHEGHEAGVELLQDDEPERGVASWASSFEKLLGDPAGLHTFAVSTKLIFFFNIVILSSVIVPDN